jgi:hypothetical protein
MFELTRTPKRTPAVHVQWSRWCACPCTYRAWVQIRRSYSESGLDAPHSKSIRPHRCSPDQPTTEIIRTSMDHIRHIATEEELRKKQVQCCSGRIHMIYPRSKYDIIAAVYARYSTERVGSTLNLNLRILTVSIESKPRLQMGPNDGAPGNTRTQASTNTNTITPQQRNGLGPISLSLQRLTKTFVIVCRSFNHSNSPLS